MDINLYKFGYHDSDTIGLWKAVQGHFESKRCLLDNISHFAFEENLI